MISDRFVSVETSPSFPLVFLDDRGRQPLRFLLFSAGFPSFLVSHPIHGKRETKRDFSFWTDRLSRGFVAHSKASDMDKAVIALHFGVYELVRRHKTTGTTPVVTAGVEWESWTLERVVEITDEYLRRTKDAKFEEAFARAEI
jgi:hypothetical protein